MSAASLAAEAEKATIAYQIALTKLGAAVIAEALLLWRRDMPTNSVPPAAAASWLRRVTALIMRRRTEARALARSYYRLERALRTGYTVADLSDSTKSVGLNQLREEFRTLAGPDAPTPGEDVEIEVERIPDLDKDAASLDAAAELEVRTALGNLGAANLDRKFRAIDLNKPGTEVDTDRQKAHDEAGARQAAAAERIALNGARGELWNATSRDKRAVGYIRLSRTGTPCGWCAMLISRGPVYKSERSATTPEGYQDGDLYHDNCHCYAVPVWTRADWQSNPLYALNREYQELWPKVTKGLGGDAALTAWRRFIRTQQRAQAARPTAQTTQEA